LYQVLKSYPYQQAVFILVLVVHDAAESFRYLAGVGKGGREKDDLTDDSQGLLLSLSASCRQAERVLMRQRYKFITMGKGFKLRHFTAATLASLKAKYEGAADYILELIEKVETLIQQRNDVYGTWERSLDQQLVNVYYRIEEKQGDAPPVEVNIGEIKIDTDAPITVLREKVRRTMRDQLNQRNGEGFGFLVS